ncbi:hypothetical protein EHQ58_12380 [Leptospira ognonensis]|uniref:Uncharacterized protein n=1 Tax=Leptospira ognonensis TaxID=2484945 RepID=A0A4R9JY73_9LEPT|nr:hypothetical protein [Leptospira ognonensis]TGL58170.1 hypothetical protein EHQ58_12380 [Leptospira ognonensis]
MKMIVRVPLVFALSSFALNFLVCSLAHRDNADAPFRLGESIIRYGEEMERGESYPPAVFGEKNSRANLL